MPSSYTETIGKSQDVYWALQSVRQTLGTCADVKAQINSTLILFVLLNTFVD